MKTEPKSCLDFFEVIILLWDSTPFLNYYCISTGSLELNARERPAFDQQQNW